jgi:hypothetical protein
MTFTPTDLAPWPLPDAPPAGRAPAAVRAAFRSGSSAALPLRLVCAAGAYDAFAATWWYFRWADDVVDAPGRDPENVRRFVASQRVLLANVRDPAGPEEAAVARALAHPKYGPGLWCAADLMLRALEFDAWRGPEPLPAAEIEAQIARIGDGFALALWTCLGASGEPTEAARELARAATAAHQLRDLREDLALGYCNVPEEALPNGLVADDVSAWAARRKAEVDARFSRALAGLSGVPWRARFVFTLLAWRYRRGLRGWGSP